MIRLSSAFFMRERKSVFRRGTTSTQFNLTRSTKNPKQQNTSPFLKERSKTGDSLVAVHVTLSWGLRSATVSPIWMTSLTVRRSHQPATLVRRGDMENKQNSERREGPFGGKQESTEKRSPNHYTDSDDAVKQLKQLSSERWKPPPLSSLWRH